MFIPVNAINFPIERNKSIVTEVFTYTRTKGTRILYRRRSRAEFEKMMLPHLGSAYNLARWLLRHPQDAEDAVQTSYLKAFKAFDQLSGDRLSVHQCTSWLLKIVRNTCLTLLKKKSNSAAVIHLDDVQNAAGDRRNNEALADLRNVPGTQLDIQATQQIVRRAINQLPNDFREIIVLREFEDLSYRQIADITGIPIGTVMSRLSRARRKLRHLLLPHIDGEQQREL